MEALEQGHAIALDMRPVFLRDRSELRPVKQHKVVRAHCVSLYHRGYPLGATKVHRPVNLKRYKMATKLFNGPTLSFY